MKKYHRYCAFCFEADDYRCNNHPDGKEVHWSEEQIKRATNCKNFALSNDVITGKKYCPRDNAKESNTERYRHEQLSFI